MNHSFILSLFTEAVSYTEPGACSLSQSSWPVPQDLVSPPKCWDYRATMPTRFYMDLMYKLSASSCLCQDMIKIPQHVNYCPSCPNSRLPEEKPVLEDLGALLGAFVLFRFVWARCEVCCRLFFINSKALVPCRNFYVFASLEQDFPSLLALMR